MDNKPIIAPVWIGTLETALKNKHIDWTGDVELDENKFYFPAIRELAVEIRLWAINQEFLTPKSLSEDEAILAKLMLVVSELGEATEAVRDQDPIGFAEELADAIIRLLHLSEGLGIPIDKVIAQKMMVNERRPIRHDRPSGV